MAGTFSIDDYLRDFQEGLTGYATNITSDHSYIHKGKGFTAVINVGTISAAYKI